MYMEACRCSADQDLLPEMVALGAWVVQEVRFANLGYFLRRLRLAIKQSR
jgi:hypothetical protein